MPSAAALAAAVWAGLAAVCVAKPLTSTYGSSIYHVSAPVASSHQSVTLSELHSLTEHTAHELARERHDDHHDKPYKFEYKVHDEKNTNYHERAESSDGQVVRGFYSLLEPHGEVRVVKYRADHDGFQSEVSRHGHPRGHEHGGGLGATIGRGASHDLGSHGLGVGVAATALSAASAAATAHIKHSIPIHEDNQEGNEWSAIEDPKKGLRGQGLEEIPAPSKEALGGGPGRVPEQLLLQQHKKKKAHGPHGKPGPGPLHHHPKFHKRPLHHGPPRPGPGPGPRPHHAPHFHHSRGPKRGPRPRNAGPPVGPPAGPSGGPPAAPQRREARPPPTPCKCSEQAGAHAPHAPGHPPPPSHGR